MARGSLDVVDISVYGQNDPWDNLIAALFGYYVSSGDDEWLIYYGRDTEGGHSDDSHAATRMLPKVRRSSSVMVYETGVKMDSPIHNSATTLTIGVRGSSDRGYEVQLNADNNGTTIRVIRTIRNTRTILQSYPSSFTLDAFHDLWIGVVDVGTGVRFTIKIDGVVVGEYIDDSSLKVSSGGSLWVEFDSTSKLESQRDKLIILRDFFVTYAETIHRAPVAMLRWSDDGGNTWSRERWESFGKVGEYRTRVRWNALGASRDRAFRLTIGDPVKVVLINSYMKVSGEDVQ